MSAVKDSYVAVPPSVTATVVSPSAERHFVEFLRHALLYQIVKLMQTVIRVQPVLLILAANVTFVFSLASVGGIRICLTGWNVPQMIEWFVILKK